MRISLESSFLVFQMCYRNGRPLKKFQIISRHRRWNLFYISKMSSLSNSSKTLVNEHGELDLKCLICQERTHANKSLCSKSQTSSLYNGSFILFILQIDSIQIAATFSTLVCDHLEKFLAVTAFFPFTSKLLLHLRVFTFSPSFPIFQKTRHFKADTTKIKGALQPNQFHEQWRQNSKSHVRLSLKSSVSS